MSRPKYKRPVGRPPKWTTPEELQPKIDAYFANTSKDEWTITGLAKALDTNRETLCCYEELAEFSDTIKKAKQTVEEVYEIDLRKKGHSGCIFALKNFGWSDQQDHDITTDGEKISDPNNEKIASVLSSFLDQKKNEPEPNNQTNPS